MVDVHFEGSEVAEQFGWEAADARAEEADEDARHVCGRHIPRLLDSERVSRLLYHWPTVSGSVTFRYL